MGGAAEEARRREGNEGKAGQKGKRTRNASPARRLTPETERRTRRQGPKGSGSSGWTVVGALIRYKKGQQREKRIRDENETVMQRVKGLYESMVRAMKRVLMEEVAMRAIREYHGLQEGVWEVEKEAGTEGVKEQEASLAQRIRLALGQAHEAQQEEGRVNAHGGGTRSTLRQGDTTGSEEEGTSEGVRRSGGPAST